jgi:outer membrane lipoprotein-sorting protein
MYSKIFKSILLLLIMTSGSIFAQSAREISRRASEAMDISSLEMASTLKIYDTKGNERVRQLAMASKEFAGVNKTLISFTSPPDVKGTSMLIYDYKNKNDDMWIFMPALRKTRRIVSSERGNNFMGSEFTNADMSRPNIEDFNYTLLGTVNYEGKNCWKVEAVCKNEDIEDEVGFSKQISWIEKGTYLCNRIETYDLNGELSKIHLLKQYKKLPGGKYLALYMEKKNVQNGRKSVLTIDKLQERSSLPETAFSPAVLEKQ